MVERRVRSRAQELYESRGQAEGNDLQDWYQAEAEILENPALAPLYKRLQGKQAEEEQNSAVGENGTSDARV